MHEIGPRGSQQPQQTGIPFIMTQQVQPAFIMVLQQSQHAWIMSQQSLSPLVQVMETPFSVISHLHIPITRLQQQAIIPFIIMQQLHMPPAIIVQRLWSMAVDVGSSQVQVIFMPPSHFSIFIVQRGIVIMFMPAGIADGAPIIPAPMPAVGAVIPIRSIMAFIIAASPQPGFPVSRPDAGPSPAAQYRGTGRRGSISIPRKYR
jgi:hypothetical protein